MDKQPVADDTMNDVCVSCGKLEPPEMEDGCAMAEVNRIGCDGCLSWYHVECCGLNGRNDVKFTFTLGMSLL